MMGGGQAIMIWFIGSGIACVLLLAWAAIAGLGASGAGPERSGTQRPGTGRQRLLALTLLALTGILAILPSGLGRMRRDYAFPFSQTLFLGATLCLLSAVIALWKLRRLPELSRSADLAIAACLNLWLALWATLTPLSYL